MFSPEQVAIGKGPKDEGSLHCAIEVATQLHVAGRWDGRGRLIVHDAPAALRKLEADADIHELEPDVDFEVLPLSLNMCRNLGIPDIGALDALLQPPRGTYICGCNLRSRKAQRPCPKGARLWEQARQAYWQAVQADDWRMCVEAQGAVFAHYGYTSWCSDAYVDFMALDNHRGRFYTLFQLEIMIKQGHESAARARVEWGLMFAKDYPNK